MPVLGLPNLNDHRIKKILNLIKNKRFPNPESDFLCERMINYLRFDYARTQNKMIFDCYMPYQGHQILG